MPNIPIFLKTIILVRFIKGFSNLSDGFVKIYAYFKLIIFQNYNLKVGIRFWNYFSTNDLKYANLFDLWYQKYTKQLI